MPLTFTLCQKGCRALQAYYQAILAHPDLCCMRDYPMIAVFAKIQELFRKLRAKETIKVSVEQAVRPSQAVLP